MEALPRGSREAPAQAVEDGGQRQGDGLVEARAVQAAAAQQHARCRAPRSDGQGDDAARRPDRQTVGTTRVVPANACAVAAADNNDTYATAAARRQLAAAAAATGVRGRRRWRDEATRAICRRSCRGLAPGVAPRFACARALPSRAAAPLPSSFATIFSVTITTSTSTGSGSASSFVIAAHPSPSNVTVPFNARSTTLGEDSVLSDGNGHAQWQPQGAQRPPHAAATYGTNDSTTLHCNDGPESWGSPATTPTPSRLAGQRARHWRPRARCYTKRARRCGCNARTDAEARADARADTRADARADARVDARADARADAPADARVNANADEGAHDGVGAVALGARKLLPRARGGVDALACARRARVAHVEAEARRDRARARDARARADARANARADARVGSCLEFASRPSGQAAYFCRAFDREGSKEEIIW